MTASTQQNSHATATSSNKQDPNSPFGWSISDKIKPEVSGGRADVWTVFSPLSGFVPSDSLNLGQGFMNWAPSEDILGAYSEALQGVMENHYSLPRGRIALREALSDYLSESFNLPGGRKLDPNTEITVTAGANEGMFAFATAFLRDGDEVILFEPFFDQYVAQVTFNGGKPVYVPIRPPKDASTSNVSASEWKIDLDELRRAITPKTKMIWINTPHNPIGKVFDEQELRAIGQIAEELDLLILADEVYDCLALGDKKHVRVAALDDFWKRTVTVGSAGKSFAATGWRVGWAVGPAPLVHGLMAAHTRIVFCVNSPAQEAAAKGIKLALQNGFFDKQRREYEERSKVLCDALDKLGLPYTIPDGSYFVLVNWEKMQIPDDFEVLPQIENRALDWKAAWFIAKTAKVVCIPTTDFYSEPDWNIGEKYVRFAFCKDLDTLRQAGERLLALKPYIKQ
ncbi:hypothetical protein ACM66B_006156 [Microbotryomycetes sp. NB124-2]